MKRKRKNTYRTRQMAMFHASMATANKRTRVASVLRTPDAWVVVRDLCPTATAIFHRDHLVWSERKEDRVQNYFGYVCETPADVWLELEGR